jgi:N-acetylmuramoyl-L-alanine amidase
MRDINKIILHHSATKDTGTVSWNAIRRYHINECKWTSIGYHMGVEYITDPGDPKGSYEILIGRTLDEVGAHTTGQNINSIGICFVGDFDTAPPDPEQWQAGLKLVRWLCKQFNIPKSEIHGHREYANKTCPGKMFDIEKFKGNL